MTLELSLPPDVEARLKDAAARSGEPADVLAVRLLDRHLPPTDRSAAAAAMLEQWAAEAEAMTDEEAAENARVLAAIDADRLSDRKLFPVTKLFTPPGGRP